MTLAVLSLAVPAAAQWTPDTNTDMVVAGGSASQTGPAAASALWGGTIVAWLERVDDDYRVYAQRLDLDGVPQWGAGGIPIATDGGCAEITIDGDSNGGAYIAWASNQSASSSGYDIKVQHVDIDGVALGPPGGAMVCNADYGQREPVLYGTGVGAIMAWRDNRGWTSDRIYAQRVDPACVPQWTHGGVLVSSASGWNRYPKITGTGDGNVIVAWHDGNLRANLVMAADGSRPWGGGVIAAASVSSVENWDLAPGYMLGACIVFERGGHKYAQRIDGNGNLAWADDLSIATAASTSYVAMAAVENDGWTVAWLDSRDGYGIWAQHFSQDGTIHWTANGVRLSTPSPASSSLDVCWNGDFDNPGTCLVGWKETTGLRVQSIGADGLPDWDEGGVVMSSGTGGYFELTLLKDINHGAVAAYRAGPSNNDVHAEHVYADGGLGPPVSVPGFAADMGISLRIHPNPFNPAATVSYAIPAAGHVELQVVDLRGRLVSTLVDGSVPAGHHEVTWNGRDDRGLHMPSGVYLSRLQAAGRVTHGRMMLVR